VGDESDSWAEPKKRDLATEGRTLWKRGSTREEAIEGKARRGIFLPSAEWGSHLECKCGCPGARSGVGVPRYGANSGRERFNREPLAYLATVQLVMSVIDQLGALARVY
jgi:hypothetical protein